MIRPGGIVDRLAKKIYRQLVWNVGNSLDVVEGAHCLFPDLYKQRICLGNLDWQWGDLSNTAALLFLCVLAKAGYTPIVEFGTFRGRTTYNLALNIPEGEKIITIDIGEPCDADSNIENLCYGNYIAGEVFLQAEPEIREKIELIIGDSTKLDLSYLYGSVGLVIVDGGHSYEVCRSDSEKAFHLIKKGG